MCERSSCIAVLKFHVTDVLLFACVWRMPLCNWQGGYAAYRYAQPAAAAAAAYSDR